MKIQFQSYVSPSHLLKMVMLSQRAVDYSIKAHELGAAEIYRLFWKHDQQWRSLQRSIGDRGRSLFCSGAPVDANSPAAESALRIFSALHVTYTAAAEIAHSGALMLEQGRMLERGRIAPSPQLGEIGRFVNSLVRLCTAALFTKDRLHARAILRDHHGRRHFEELLCHTQQALKQIPGTQARLELAIAWALGQIAEQTYEIAHAFMLGMEGEHHSVAWRATPCIAA